MSETKLRTKRPSFETGDLPELLANSAIHRKYKLGKVLHRDFAGTLYTVSQSMPGDRDMAVKVLNAGYALITDAVAAVEHPRICRIRNTIIERDTIQAVVHEKPAGRSLTAHLKAVGPLPPGEAVIATLQLLSAIHAVHWGGAVVGNLHADSVFLSRDKQNNLEIQLANLGIGCTKDNLREEDYLAPEQIMGGKIASLRSDIWAAGAILYQMLSSRRPFVGENRYAVAGEILLQEVSFDGEAAKIPDTLKAVIRRAMEKDDKLRYETTSEMIAALMPLQESYNEPMSEAVAAVIRDSIPPEGTGEHQRPTRSNTSKLKAIPTVRISHTPNSPPAGMGTKKDTATNVTGRKRPVMQTKLGMPAISIPAKHIPLKSKEDTSTFVRPKSEPPLDLSAYAERKARASASRPPAPTDEVSKETVLEIEKPKIAPKKAGEVGIPKVIKAVIAGASPAQKKIAAAGIAGFITVLILIAAFSGDAPKKAAPTPKPTSPVAAAKKVTASAAAPLPAKPSAPPAAAPKKTDVAGETSLRAAAETAEAAEKPVEAVKILLRGMLPNNAVVRVDGTEVASLPIFTEKGDTPVTITVEAAGYKTFSAEVVPVKNRSIKLSMKKETADANDSGKPAKRRKAGSKKKPKSGKDLAANPFGG